MTPDSDSAANLSIDQLLRLSVFAPLVESDFEVARGAEKVSLRLFQARKGMSHRDEVSECFSLIFAAGPEKPLQQGIHAFEHPQLGIFELFITPVTSTQKDFRHYEAVINRSAAL